MLTREIHLEMAQCLRVALLLLSKDQRDFKQTYVCHAIERTSSRGQIKVLLKNWIYEQLGGSGPYVSWLTDNCPEFANRKEVYGKNLDFGAKIQAGRRAWMENMIKVLEC
jgi:hypothetical protein